ncbi:MAG: PKD domain-containing protein, partial [Desulfobulbaceae bacterium]|nr:PKD domain-containing protein [Desulfobulbaceae bacterium]
ILDQLQKLKFSISDTGSGLDENTPQIFIDDKVKTALSTFDENVLTYTPTSSDLLPQPTFRATVIAADLLGNEASATFDFQVQPQVVLSATPTAMPQTAYAPATIRFSPKVTTTNAIQTYKWDFDGNGSYDRSDIIGNSYTWKYSTPGEYTVALRVQDKTGETAIGYVTVNILNAASSVSAEASPSNGEVPLTVTFTATVSDNEGIGLLEWDFEGDGSYDYNSTSSARTTHTYTETGQFTATLRVTDKLGEITTYTLPTTTVNAAPPGSPTVTATSNISSGKVPLTVNLSATATDPENKAFVLWQWDFDGDGAYDYSNTQSATVSHVYEQAGTHYPAVRVTTEDNRTSIDTLEIKVINSLSLSRDRDTIDTTLTETAQIKTTLGGTTKISIVIEDREMNVIRTLVGWTERTGGTYTDSWDGWRDDATMAAEGDYYAVLLYMENGLEKRLDLRNGSGGTRYNPSRNNAARTFAPFDNNPMKITYQLPRASEVTAFMGYSYSNTRVVTFLSREPQAKGSHTVLWYGTNNEGVVIYAPRGKYFMFGVWAYSLADNAIYVKSGSHLLDITASPPIYDPTGHDESGKRTTSKISFNLTGDATIELSVTDAQTGSTATVRSYPDLGAGDNTIEWDGRDSAGEFLAPGRYRLGLTAIDHNGYRSLTGYTLQRIYY